MQQAAAIGLTYLAAWLGLVEYARLAPSETLLVIGTNGGVGGAAAQIGKWRGARVIGVDRQEPRADSSSSAAIDDFFVLDRNSVGKIIRSATKGLGADVVFDSVGGPMFEPGLKALAHRGRQLEIASAVDRRVSFDLVNFYHNEGQLFGVDTRARDATASAALLEGLMPFFEQDTFRPPSIDRVVALADGRSAYDEVDRGQVRGRIVLTP
jgi:NADPH:quinone reductase-like Zn-dependent oxidoreductase